MKDVKALSLLLLIAVCVFLIILSFPIFEEKKEGICILDNSTVKITNVETNKSIVVDETNVSEIRESARALKRFYGYVYKKPTHIMYVFNDSKEEVFSFFCDDGYIYQGHFLDAWYERMNDRKSELLRINSRFSQLVLELGS